ncbi:hypothetical protein SASPL_151303 [Salvia splendens]|uniref:Uncharacterized protein n=1 Tax=Salvia splendens TaxID=180675 RepID=A0A8X8W912_SALSN|nr:hypothetical protein SASPL_151303 [Salvia splendens]
MLIVRNPDGRRCTGSESIFPRELDTMRWIECIIAILSIFLAPIASIVSRFSKYPIYSEHIMSDELTKRYGTHDERIANASSSWIMDPVAILTATARPAVKTLLATLNLRFTFSLLISSIGAPNKLTDLDMEAEERKREESEKKAALRKRQERGFEVRPTTEIKKLGLPTSDEMQRKEFMAKHPEMAKTN